MKRAEKGKGAEEEGDNMELLSQINYPAGDTYEGTAIYEVDHYEFLKTYSVDDAVSNIISATEQAAAQEGYVLLRTYVYYESGTAYHLFDVKYYFVMISPSGMVVIPTVLPGALIWAIIIIIGAIVGYFLVRATNTSINSVQYVPGSEEGGGGLPKISPFGWAIILVAAGFMINALSGLTRQARYLKD